MIRRKYHEEPFTAIMLDGVLINIAMMLKQNMRVSFLLPSVLCKVNVPDS